MIDERERRWRLALGAEPENAAPMSDRDRRLSDALSALYDEPEDGRRRAGLGGSAPKVAAWLGDIREFFPAPVVRVVQRDAMERRGLKKLLLEPEMLDGLEPDVNLAAELVALKGAMPEKAKATARVVIGKVVEQLMARLRTKTEAAVRGATDRRRRIARPRFRDIDWPRTVRANLRHWQPELRTIVPEKLIGFGRKSRRAADLDDVTLCLDQSGSMAPSVVYASIFAAVMASLPGLRLRMVCFDTAVVDLTETLDDPVETLFGVQLGGGTDIARAVAYCAERIERPGRSTLILITDLFEGGDREALVARLASLIGAGVNVIVLLALSDQGKPAHDPSLAGRIAALGAPVFACTPDLFPEMMAAALERRDLPAWAASRDVKLARAAENPVGETPPGT